MNLSMKARLILIHILLLLITSGVAFCQTEPSLPGELYAPDLYPDISTYFNNYWLEGDILLSDGNIKRAGGIKYNGLLDELLWLEPLSNQIIKLDKEAILQFHFLNLQGDTSIYFRKLKVKRAGLNDSIEIFAQELVRGDLSLYVLHSFYLARKVAVRQNNSYILKDIYEEEPVYYISYLNNKVVGYKTISRKSIYAIAPDKKDKIREYLSKSNSGTIKTIPEMISLIQFINSVTGQTN